MIDFLSVGFIFCDIFELTDLFQEAFCRLFGISYIDSHDISKKGELYVFLSNLQAFISFLPIVPAHISSTLLNKCDENGHLCLIPISGRK